MLWVSALVCHLAMCVHGADVPLQGIPRFPVCNHDQRIRGGTKIYITAAPYQVFLREKGIINCGGSIIDRRFVLTAGHCVSGTHPKDWKVGYGVSVVSDANLLVVRRIVLHPKYNQRTTDYDAAVMTVDQQFVFSPKAQPIVMVNAGEETETGTQVQVSGWGETGDGRPHTYQLRAAVLRIFNNDICKRLYDGRNGTRRVTPRMICAASPAKDKDSCKGDSGGPLVNIKTKKLVGIISFGRRDDVSLPGVYTNIANSEVREFIKNESGK